MRALGCHSAPLTPSLPWVAPEVWAFQEDQVLSVRRSTCGWHRLHSFQAWLWTNGRLRDILVWSVFTLFLFGFNLCSIIIHSKHSEVSSRAILQLQPGFSLLSSPVLLYRADWRLKQVKYNICLYCFGWVLFLLFVFSLLFTGSDQVQRIIVKLKWNGNHLGSKNACKSC